MKEKTYYENGNVKTEYEKNDNEQFEGLYREYFESGQKKLEYNYRLGKLNGECKEYYENGKLKAEYYCNNGEFDGLYKKYYPNGELETEYNYKDGKLEEEDKKNNFNTSSDINKELKIDKIQINVPEYTENINNSVETPKVEVKKQTSEPKSKKEVKQNFGTNPNRTNKSFKVKSQNNSNKIILLCLIPIFLILVATVAYFGFKKFSNKKQEIPVTKSTEISQPQAQQENVKSAVVENERIPTVEDARYINYKTYYNSFFDYYIDYPDDEYFKISKTYEDGMRLNNYNGDVIISLTSNWNPNGESLQQAYDKAVREKPNAVYKFLGKTFFTITYEDSGLLVFRKTMYDKESNKYVYLYVSFPPEYKPYMTPIVERMANSMKKSSSTQSNTILSNVIYKTYYNDYYGYSIDYPISEDLYTSSRDNEGMEIKSYDDNVYISVLYGYDDYGDNLQQAYNRAVSEYPYAPYKFLGKTFFTITYEEDGLLVFRKTVYDKVNNGYIYLYVSFPPEYKEYMTPIVEKMANTIKKR
jgi:MORN repeat protein